MKVFMADLAKLALYLVAGAVLVTLAVFPMATINGVSGMVVMSQWLAR